MGKKAVVVESDFDEDFQFSDDEDAPVAVKLSDAKQHYEKLQQ